MAYHLTFGGLVVDEYMHVLGEDGNVVAEGLYSGGDILDGFEDKTHQSGPCMSIAISLVNRLEYLLQMKSKSFFLDNL